MLNEEATRTFVWEELDPYVQMRGMSRGTMAASLFGSSLWLMILVVTMAARGRFDFGLLLALAAPYAAIMLVLVRGRTRCPHRIYLGRLMMMIGAYLVYMAALMQASTRWADLLLLGQRTGPTVPAAMAIGAGLVIVGWMQVRFHRSLLRETPAAALLGERNPRGKPAEPGT